MLGGLIRKIVGTRNEREIKRLAASVDLVNAQEPAVRRLSDAALRGNGQGGSNLSPGAPDGRAILCI